MTDDPGINGFRKVALAVLMLVGIDALPWSPVGRGGQEERILEDLLALESPDRTAREARIRAALDEETVARLLDGASGLTDMASRRLASILSSGGPWMPAVIRSLERPGPTAVLGRTILENALDKRPYLREIVSPSVAATTMIDPFGHNRPGEGKYLYFPGTWPRGLRLDEFLDRINETSLPAFPFVLHPALGSDPTLVLDEIPLEGPAALVMDSVLSGFRLRVTYLETVALVGKAVAFPDSPGGGDGAGSGLQNQFGTEQRSDALLVDSICSILSDPGTPEAQRRAARKALAYLDLPGLFEGYYQALGSGETYPALDILLHGPLFARLAAGLIENEDQSTLELLVEALSKLDSRAGSRRVGENPNLESGGPPASLAGIQARRRQLTRFLFTLSRAHFFRIPGGRLHLAPEESIPSLLDPEKPDRALHGLRAVLLQGPFEPGPGTAVVDRLAHWPRAEGETARLIDACLRNVLAGNLDDGRLALLVRNPVTRAGILEAAAVLGNRAALDAIIELIRSGRAADLRSIQCAAAILRRMHPRDGGREHARGYIDSTLPPAGRICMAGLLLSLSAKEAAEEEEFLLDRLREGGPERRAAARMISFLDGARLLDRLESLHSVAGALPPEILEELEKAVLRCASRSSIVAGRLRLAIRRLENPDRWSRLLASLGVLERLSGGDYLRVAVDF